MRKSIILGIVTVFLSFSVFAQNALLIQPEDIRLEQEGGNDFESISGYHLYIRKKPGMNSVMLTETTKDPNGKAANYAFRATEWNEINGDEVRVLNGKILDSEVAKYSLIDSTPRKDPELGMAFHIYIPAELVYGYPNARHGTVKISRGTFINIRAFAKKYCDYDGAFFDNPYMFNLETRRRPLEPVAVIAEEKKAEDIVLTDGYNPDAAASFKELSDSMIYANGPDSLVDDISACLDKMGKGPADVVFAIDATGSMKDDIEVLRDDLIPRLVEQCEDFESIRFGLLLYRDYGDNFNTKGLPVKYFAFTSNFEEFERNLNGFTVRGNEGGDIPEAVYEALFASMDFYVWRPDVNKKIILIGDAEPHPTPRGTKKYTKKLVDKLSKEKNISITSIILPDDKVRRGR